ncbi:hypothetical protein ABK040_000793 [Willaertia magna]
MDEENNSRSSSRIDRYQRQNNLTPTLSEEEEQHNDDITLHQQKDDELPKTLWQRHRKTLLLGLILIGAFLFIVFLTLIASNYFIKNTNLLNNDNNKCLKPPSFKINYDQDYEVNNDIHLNPIQAYSHVILQNANVISTSDIHYKGKVKITKLDLLFENGTITRIAPSVSSGNDGSSVIENELKVKGIYDIKVYNAEGKFVTAGLVDMHSHIGVHPSPVGLKGNTDVNEKSSPITPFVRAVDALNPNDANIELVRKYGGVTTHLVIPGSANVMGGEGVYVKLKNNKKTVSEMLIKNVPRALKMACGENPKRVYSSLNQTPMTRMGSAWILRKTLDEARQLKLKQDQWDCNEEVRKNNSVRPYDLTLDPVVGMLRQEDVILAIHCYQSQDMETMIRLSKEFNFKINAFHHATEGYKIAEMLKRNNISIALFADKYTAKIESYDNSVHGASILRNYDVPVAMHSDHPVTSGKYLLLNAAKTHHYGLDEQSALNSVTSVPAEIIGLGNRIGKIELGYDADVVVWDRFPLKLGAMPDKIFIDGNLLDDNQLPLYNEEAFVKKSTETLEIKTVGSNEVANEQRFCSYDSDQFGLLHPFGYSIENAKIYTMNSQNTVIENGNIIVDKNGNITCVGSATTCPIPSTVNGHVVYHVNNGIVIPGMIESSSFLGLAEIRGESPTTDGVLTNYNNYPFVLNLQAKDGIKMRTKPIKTSWKSGVTISISHRLDDLIINGVTSAFTLDGIIVGESLINNIASLHINIGEAAKTGSFANSVSGQLNFLRDVFSKKEHPIIGKVLSKEIPVSAMVNQVDHIGFLVELKQQFDFNIIIIGGAEAYLIKDILRDNNVSVILTPYSEELTDRSYYDTLKSTTNFGIEELFNSGVKIGLGMGKTLSDIRNLRFLAGLVKSTNKDTKIKFDNALSFITKNVADIFGLNEGAGRIIEKTKANFVLFDEDPLSFSGKPKVVAVGSRADCNLVQP